MKHALKQYFTFASRDRRAVLVLTACIVVMLFIPLILPYLISDKPDSFTEFEEQIKLYKEDINKQEQQNQQQIAARKTGNNKYNQETETNPNTIAQISSFNPNQLNAAQAEALGLPPKVASNIEKYLQKGGKFRKPEDFAKIYGMTDADYQRLLPYLVFEDKPTTTVPTQTAVAATNTKVLPPLAPFNPNQLNATQAEALGLPPKVASNIEKYLQKGGKFKKPEDFAKIYGMTDADYQRLLPYINLPADAIAANTPAKEKTERMEFSNFTDPDMPKPAGKNDNLKIDINTATAEDWDKLRGIGPTYANMIVNYRNKLGGFISTEQVKEVRGLPEETYSLIAPNLVNTATKAGQPLNINTADVLTLEKHPYIDKQVAQSIVNLRQQHGKYTSVEGIKKSKLIDETLYQKIAPYLSIE